MATQMQLEVILAGNCIASREIFVEKKPAPESCKAETTKESTQTKTESGNCFCIRVV